MKIPYVCMAGALTFFAATGHPQTKGKAEAPQAKAAAKTSAATIADLVMQGKVPEAAKLAVKSPAAAESAMHSLMASADTQIAARKTADAQATLEAAQKFMEACDKAGSGKTLPREALKGRQMRFEGIQFSNQQDYAKSEAFLRQALQISKNVKDPVLEAAVHNNLGFALQGLDLLEEALKEYDTARQMADEQKDDVRSGSANFNMGEVLYQLRRLEPALIAFKRAAEKSRAASRPDIEGLAIRKQAVVLGAQDPRSQEAVRLFQEAETLFEKIGDQQNAGWTYYMLGDHIAYSMNFRLAAEYGEKALTLLAKGNNQPNLKRCYEFLGDMYGRLGDIPKAEKFKKQAQDLEIKK
jgi:tetratricopeptide (TPR) repeat protein